MSSGTCSSLGSYQGISPTPPMAQSTGPLTCPILFYPLDLHLALGIDQGPPDNLAGPMVGMGIWPNGLAIINHNPPGGPSKLRLARIKKGPIDTISPDLPQGLTPKLGHVDPVWASLDDL